jgi:acyl-CoA reductase-like NAD-dependent aldehyde dehydrogenase
MILANILNKGSNFISATFANGEGNTFSVLNKHNGAELAQIKYCSTPQLEEVSEFALSFFELSKSYSFKQKYVLIEEFVKQLELHQDLLADCIKLETGKSSEYAKNEVERAILNGKFAMAFCMQNHGENVNLDFGNSPHSYAMVKRFPTGPVLAFSPFNFPLNLALHKIFPAWAAGAPVVLKPSPKTPLSALILAQLFTQIKDFETYKGMLQVVNCNNSDASFLVKHSAYPIFSFTGSHTVGFDLKATVPHKKVLLELGGNAAAIVHHDIDNLEEVVQKLILGSFLYGGQICISTQRIYVHKSIEVEFKRLFTLATNNYNKQNSQVLIDQESKDRIKSIIQESTTKGAKILAGGIDNQKNTTTILATIIENPPIDSACVSEEVFGPLVSVFSYTHFEEVLKQVNLSKFGLQTGVFTQNIDLIKLAFEKLEVGAVIANNAPGYRVDNMPYGGTKLSGVGREGIAYAYQEFTEPKLLIW